jgi:hypothetical protein
VYLSFAGKSFLASAAQAGLALTRESKRKVVNCCVEEGDQENEFGDART